MSSVTACRITVRPQSSSFAAKVALCDQLPSSSVVKVARIRELGDVCLWCDEYFTRHYRGPKGEARRREPQLYGIEA